MMSILLECIILVSPGGPVAENESALRGAHEMATDLDFLNRGVAGDFR